MHAAFWAWALLERFDPWLPFQVGIALLVVLSMFGVLGGALDERRNELGLETLRCPHPLRSVSSSRAAVHGTPARALPNFATRFKEDPNLAAALARERINAPSRSRYALTWCVIAAGKP